MAWVLVDFECPKHGKTEQLLERPAPDTIPCPTCGEKADKVFPRPGFVRVDLGCVRGKSDPPPPTAYVTDPDWSPSKRKAHNKRRREILNAKLNPNPYR